jgi:hypothetical protein
MIESLGSRVAHSEAAVAQAIYRDLEIALPAGPWPAGTCHGPAGGGRRGCRAGPGGCYNDLTIVAMETLRNAKS